MQWTLPEFGGDTLWAEDNRATLHYPVYNYGDFPRRMERVLIAYNDIPHRVRRPV